MNNYLQLLSTDLICTVLDKVADLYEGDISRIEKKINRQFWSYYQFWDPQEHYYYSTILQFL